MEWAIILVMVVPLILPIFNSDTCTVIKQIDDKTQTIDIKDQSVCDDLELKGRVEDE